MKFNTGKFNVKSTNKVVLSATINMSLSLNKPKYILEKYASGNIDLKLNASGKQTVYVYPEIMETEGMKLSLEGKPTTTHLIKNVNEMNLALTASGIANIQGENTLSFQNINLRPGEQIEINLCDLTITKDGENILHTESEISEWFEFLLGKNMLDFQTNGDIDVEIFWKDRWL